MTTADRLVGPSELVLDLYRRRVTVAGHPVELKRREYDLLVVLLEQRGRVVSFDELARQAWGHELGGDARFIYTTAWRLRRTLEAAGAPDIVESVRGVGYYIGEGARSRQDATDGSDDTVSGGEFDDDDQNPGRTGAFALFDPTDPDLRLSMANEAAAELSGYSVHELTHLPEAATRLWSPIDRSFIDEAVRVAMATGTAESHGRRLLRADGEAVLVDVYLRRLDHPGRAPHMLAEVEPAENESN